MELEGKNILSVWELTREIRDLLERGFAHVFVQGEITNSGRATSGHVYFSLKDARAVLPCVLWASQARLLRFRPENGLSVVCRGRVTVYEPRGAYQFVVDTMDPLGSGALLVAFEQLKARLAEEGLFDPARKRPLPALPGRIGVVTSPSGAAIRDILHVIGGRYPNANVLVLPARVQGEGAAREIADMIDYANRHALADVLIVGRGGGSMEDLWAFNEEVVARAIAASAIPVVSAVGHEIDFTIADLVADARAPTPSVAGELVVPRKADLVRQVAALRDQLALLASGAIRVKRREAQVAFSRLRDPRGRLENRMLRVDDLGSRLQAAARHRLAIVRHRLTAADARLRMRSPLLRLERDRAGLRALAARLRRRAIGLLRERKARADAIGHRLTALSPLAILGRGYAIVQAADGRVVSDAAKARVGDDLRVRLARGELGARVTKVRPSGG